MDEDVDIPTFQFVDQNGQWYTADLLPIDDPDPTHDDFYTGSTPIDTLHADGGLLGIVPLLGGSGPESAAPLPYSLGLGSEATNAINVPLNNPTGRRELGHHHRRGRAATDVHLFRHRHQPPRLRPDRRQEDGIGRRQHRDTVPVTLDGHTHEATFSMEDIV